MEVSQLYDYPHPYILEDEELADAIEERAKFGVSKQDIYNYCSYIDHVYVHMLRQLNTSHSSEMIKHVLNVSDSISESSLDVAEFSSSDYIRVMRRWSKVKTEQKRVASIFFKQYYFDVLPPNPVLPDDVYLKTRKTLEAALAMPEIDFMSTRSIIPDPTLVSVEDQAKHTDERMRKGFSQYDLRNPGAYLSWLNAQALIFFASTSSHTTGGGYKSFEEWKNALVSTVKNLFIAGYTKDIEKTRDHEILSAVGKIPSLVLTLWD